jgi:hypothetical protein
MFRQLVTPPGSPALTQQVRNNIDSLFMYHPLQISAIVETIWLNRNNNGISPTFSPFIPWRPDITNQILGSTFFPAYDWSTALHPPMDPATYPLLPSPFSFQPPLGQPRLHPLPQASYWDHAIYALIVENTHIHEVFLKILEKYMYGEELETPSAPTQLFLRNLEFLIFGDAMPSMVWTTSGRTRRDEVANRLTLYYWMFGVDSTYAPELAVQHPYQKPAASNRDFIPTFEAFGREVWRGIINAKNTSGANDTDPSVIATLARRLYDMMATRRLNGNLSREEFRAVAVMSFLHLSVLYDSPVVVDLKAQGSSPEMRLQKLAERVGMNANPKSKPLFDLAGPFSQLMQLVEAGTFNEPSGAQTLYAPATAVSRVAEKVVDQYTLATGRDLKSVAVNVVPRSATSAAPKQPPHRALAAPRANGHTTVKQ